MVEVGFETSTHAPKRAVIATPPRPMFKKNYYLRVFVRTAWALVEVPRGQHTTELIFNRHFIPF